MIHHRVFYWILKLFYAFNRYKDNSLSEIEVISSYKETMSNCQSLFDFVKKNISELFNKTIVFTSLQNL